MSFLVNGKNLALGRLMVRGKNADKRMKYIHVSSKGTSVITPEMVARVSLPADAGVSGFHVPAIIPQSELDKLRPLTTPESDELIELPAGLPAVTQPEYVVPQIDKCFPAPEHTTGTFTCNADLLRKLLTVACEVSKDGDKTIRLRICADFNTLRIDGYRQPGDQDFCGVLKGIDYTGEYIPGELPTGYSPTAKPEMKPTQRALGLKVNSGRRFRGTGE